METEDKLNKMLADARWKEFRIGDLFERVSVKKLPYKLRDLPEVPNSEYNLPILAAATKNNGLTRYAPKEGATILKDVITIALNGDAGTTFYQSKDFTILQDAYAIRLKKNLLEKPNRFIYLFLAVSIKKSIYEKYSYECKANWNRVAEEYIQLPITPEETIDYNFIENFMKELETHQMKELETYLKVTGLADYTLTTEEKQAIDKFDELNWQEFKIGELFDKIEVKKLPYKLRELPEEPNDVYNLPVLAAATTNNGLTKYIPKEGATVLNNVISIAANGDAGTTFYQSKDFTVLQDAYAIRLKPEVLENPSKLVNLYLTTAIKKSIYEKYSYEYKAGWNKVKHESIYLPVTSSGEIDYNYMEVFINATQKLVIKDLVIYNKEKLEATKEIVTK